MKKDFRSLVCVPLMLAALAGVVVAQEVPVYIPAVEASEAAPAPAVVVPAPAVPVTADCAVPCDPCCTPLKKVCCPQPHKKTKTHTEYSHKCEEYCLPKSSCLAKLFGMKNDCNCCQSCCDDTACGKVHERKKLVKKIRKEEIEEMKCEPVLVPDEQPCKPCKVSKKHKAEPCCPVVCDPCVSAPCGEVMIAPATVVPVAPMPAPK